MSQDMTLEEEVQEFLLNFSTGGVSGVMAKILTAPMERVKLILQLQNILGHIPPGGPYKGLMDCFVRIQREEGIRGYWKGDVANIIRYFPTQALNFAFKDKWRDFFMKGVSRETEFFRYFVASIAAGGATGATSSFVVYPLDFAYTRYAVDRCGPKAEFRSLWNCMRQIRRTDGMGGLYRGYGASLQGIIIYRGCYFGLFDVARESLPDPDKTPIYITWPIAQVTTSISAIVAYPWDTVRRRMMMQSGLPQRKWKYCCSMDCWKKIRKEEGFRAYFKGTWSNLLRGSSEALVLVLFHEFKTLLDSYGF